MITAVPSIARRRFPLIHFFGGIWRCRCGAAAVEMAFVLPAFLTLLLGIEEVGRAVWTQSQLQSAAEAAARCAAINAANCTPDVPTYAANQTASLSASDFTYNGSAGCGKLVTASHVFDTAVPQLVPFSVTLTASSCRP